MTVKISTNTASCAVPVLRANEGLFAGVIQTMNFAENGRHLANQDYTICMRQEQGRSMHAC